MFHLIFFDTKLAHFLNILCIENVQVTAILVAQNEPVVVVAEFVSLKLSEAVEIASLSDKFNLVCAQLLLSLH